MWAGRIEEALRDGLVFGVHDHAVRQALLRETNLTLDNAIRIAESFVSTNNSTVMKRVEVDALMNLIIQVQLKLMQMVQRF